MTREEYTAYLQSCISENLNHARHVENERLTFTSIYVATTIGAVAAIFALSNRIVAAIMAGALFLFSIMAIDFNRRWQQVFREHQARAERCQQALAAALATPVELQNFLLPEDCIYPYHYEKQESALARMLGRFARIPLEEAMAFDGAKKVAEPKNPLSRLQRLLDWLGHTSNLFYLMYSCIAILMFFLSCYLLYRAHQSPTGPAFYFNDLDISRLEDAINHIVDRIQETTP